jgi:hypothetical protein
MTIAGRLAEPPDNERDELRRALLRTQRQLAQAKAKTADHIDAVYQAARDAAVAIGPAPTVPAPKARKGRHEEVMLVHTTDWQVGKHTSSYNSEIAWHRLVDTFCRKVGRLAEIQREAHKVDRAVWLFGGDMLEGTNIFRGQVWEVDSTRFDQLFRVVAIMEAQLLFSLGTFRTTEVVVECGNHGRLGRFGEDAPGENLDLIAYQIVKDRLQRYIDKGRLVWNDHPGTDYVPFTVGNYRGLLIHADEIRSFGQTPMFAIHKRITAWKAGGIPVAFQDTYGGHYHTPFVIVLPDGHRYFGTGSPESGNQFASVVIGATSQPSQRVHMIDPERGRVTAEYVVNVDE